MVEPQGYCYMNDDLSWRAGGITLGFILRGGDHVNVDGKHVKIVGPIWRGKNNPTWWSSPVSPIGRQ